jgi:hypothetical protein
MKAVAVIVAGAAGPAPRAKKSTTKDIGEVRVADGDQIEDVLLSLKEP